ncbi:MAG TPA: chemotaxis-specific protein-glutamate methyltransferase CheB [bacterium]|nr:chemotaxis-specific protein-glutamate methyltransferase CheB [bacterium]
MDPRQKIRIAIADDDRLVRKLLSQVLGACPQLELVAQAEDGPQALADVDRLLPEALVLDMEMPGLDGLEVLRVLRRRHPRIKTIIFCSGTARSATVSTQALLEGASDFILKPSSASLAESRAYLGSQLLPRILELCRPVAPAAPTPGPSPSWEPRRAVPSAGRAKICCIGASTGGPRAVESVLKAFPKDFPLPVLVVVHMPPIFSRSLADSLDRACQIRVHEAVQGEPILPGVAYLAPGDWHMEVDPSGPPWRLRLGQGPPENSCRPAVDVLFRSAAQALGQGVLAAVLTGMGRDGTNGSEAVRRAGGRVLAQDEASSVVWGMPGFVAKAGLAEAVLPLDRIAEAFMQRIWMPGALAPPPLQAKTEAP